MKKRIPRRLILAASLSWVAVLLAMAPAEAQELGQKAPSFTLTDPSGKRFEFEPAAQPRKTLLLFYWSRH